MVYYSAYCILLQFTMVNITIYYGLLYSKYYALLWCTTVNTTFYYALLQ